MHEVEDRRYRSVRIRGRLHVPVPGSHTLVIVVHGLGGDAAAPYMVDAASAAASLGFASLRINLRGSDRSGEDFYHAGLTSDLHALLDHPDVQRFERVFLLGYSLGGHLALKTAAERPKSSLAGVAAVCPPVELWRGARALDDARRTLYRAKLLSNLKAIYREVAVRRGLPLPPAAVDAIHRIQDWDERVVAPHWGFSSARSYYKSQSVGPILGEIDLPAVVVAARRDPMVLAHTVRPELERATNLTTFWVERGGHIGFPRSLDLGIGGSSGIAGQLLHWLAERAPVTTFAPRTFPPPVSRHMVS